MHYGVDNFVAVGKLVVVVLKIAHGDHASVGNTVAETTRDDAAIELVVDAFGKYSRLKNIRGVIKDYLLEVDELFLRAFSEISSIVQKYIAMRVF